MTAVGLRDNTRRLAFLADPVAPINRKVVPLESVDEVGQLVPHGVVPATRGTCASA